METSVAGVMLTALQAEDMEGRRALRNRVDGPAREEVVKGVLAAHVIVCFQHREERSLTKLARSNEGDVADVLLL